MRAAWYIHDCDRNFKEHASYFSITSLTKKADKDWIRIDAQMTMENQE